MVRWTEEQKNQILFSVPIFIFRTRIKPVFTTYVPSAKHNARCEVGANGQINEGKNEQKPVWHSS